MIEWDETQTDEIGVSVAKAKIGPVLIQILREYTSHSSPDIGYAAEINVSLKSERSFELLGDWCETLEEAKQDVEEFLRIFRDEVMK